MEEESRGFGPGLGSREVAFPWGGSSLADRSPVKLITEIFMTHTFSKFICSAVAAIILPATVMAAPDPNFHIYLALGQSNMQGAAPVQEQDRTLHPRVQVLQSENCSQFSERYGQWRAPFQPLIRCPTSPGGLGPGDSFARTMADAAGENVTIGIVGGAYGGAAIEYFLKDCASHNACTPPYGAIGGAPNNGNSGGYVWVLDLARRAQEVGVIKGIIFHQGESNSGQATWLNRVNQYVTDLRNDLGLDPQEVPFIAGELPYTGCCIGHNQLVRQIPQYVENGHWVSADGGLGDRGDALHWDSAAVREMGLRYAAKMLEVANLGPEDCGTQGGVPVCCSIEADPDGDGLGVQNGDETCVVTEATRGWHPPNPADVVVAINVGGGAEPFSFEGIWYSADQFYQGGTTHATQDTIAGANGSAIYSTERYGDFSYTIPLANGNYTVQLGMVEIYQTNPGARAFNVQIEGEPVLNNLDIFASVGHDTLLLSDLIAVSINDGTLDIEVESVVDNGTLSSILVRKVDPTASSSSSTAASSVSSTSSSSSISSSSASNPSSEAAAPSPPTSGGALGWLLLLGLGVFSLRSANRRG